MAMTDGEFDTPRGDDPGEESILMEEFDAPDSEESFAAEAEDAEINAFLGSAGIELLEAKREIEKYLNSISPDEIVQSEALASANIVGVGIGITDPDAESFQGAPGEPALELYVIEPESIADVKARIAAEAGVSVLATRDFPVNVVVTGIIDAQSHRMRLRPAPGGVSVGHKDITAGTLGCLVRGRRAPRNRRLMILSNNHVLANSNAGKIGDCICQPGRADAGQCPRDQIAVLERFVPIKFGGANNYVDCATGWAWADRVRPELMHIRNGAIQYFRVGRTPVAATPGLAVGKTGRTTQLTSGRVSAVGVTIRVNFGNGRVATFADQVAVRNPSGNFSAGGDSGSLIWTWDARRAPVALLFAGGGGTTFGNRIGRVLDALDVNLY